MQLVLERGSIDKPLTFDVGLIQFSFIPVCSPNTCKYIVVSGAYPRGAEVRGLLCLINYSLCALSYSSCTMQNYDMLAVLVSMVN